MSNLLPPSEVGISSADEIRRPSSAQYERKCANITYMSDTTGEHGCIEVRPNSIEEDVLRQYAQKFPKECKMFLDEVKTENAMLYRMNAMSQGQRMMSLGRIPEVLECALKFLHGETFGDNKVDWYNFFRRNPKFMIGDHTPKQHGNVIIK